MNRRRRLKKFTFRNEQEKTVFLFVAFPADLNVVAGHGAVPSKPPADWAGSADRRHLSVLERLWQDKRIGFR